MSKKQSFLSSLIVFIVLLVTYAPLARANYGFGDDFVLLLSEESLEHAYLADGRPLFALAQRYVHERVSSVQQFGWFRLASAVAIGIMCMLFLRAFRLLRGGQISHVALAIAVGTLPCLQTYVAQANFWLALYAGFAALSAVMLTRSAIMIWRVGDPARQRLTFSVTGRLLAATLLMLAAASTYQPMLSWYWTIVVVYLLSQRMLTSATYRKQILWVIGFGFIYFIVCFLAFQLFFALDGGAAKSRTALTHQPLYKMYWFLRIQLPQALNFWRLMGTSQRLLSLGIAAVSIVLVSTAFLCSAQWASQSKSVDRKIAWFRALLVLMTLLLTHVHWLVIAIVPQSYRIIAPLGVACLVIVYWAITEHLRGRVWMRQSPVTFPGFMIAMAVSAVLVCQHYGEKYWILPHSIAYRYMLLTIRDHLQPQTNRVYLVQQSDDESFVEEWFIESFGRSASERDWTIQAMVRAVVKDAGLAKQIKLIEFGKGDQPVTDEKATLVIDMRKIALMRFSQTANASEQP